MAYRRRYHRNQRPKIPKFMSSLYDGICAESGEAFTAGTEILWDPVNRITFNKASEFAKDLCTEKPVNKCWNCDSPEGFFRQEGPATPVKCDECAGHVYPRQKTPTNPDTLRSAIDKWLESNSPHRPKTHERTRSLRSVYTRFSGGGESYRNENGRCIDAPCCGCCS